MLTLVAAVLVYDLAYDPTTDLAEGLDGRDDSSLALSLNAMSDTRCEKDIVGDSTVRGFIPVIWLVIIVWNILLVLTKTRI